MKTKIELVIDGKIKLSETVEVSPRTYAQKALTASLCFVILTTLDSIEKQKIESDKEVEES